MKRTLAALHCFQNILCTFCYNKMQNLSEEIRRMKDQFPRQSLQRHAGSFSLFLRNDKVSISFIVQRSSFAF